MTAFITDKSFVVVSHIFLTGPGDKLYEYLCRCGAEVLYIGHPFDYAQKKKSFALHYKPHLKCQKRREALFGKWPGFLNYVKDTFVTISVTLRGGRKDVYIGINNLNAAAGIVLRALGFVKYVIFYTIDYVPRRFDNALANVIYHAIDRFAVKHADKVWNLSGRMVTEREKRRIPRKYHHKQIVVAMGADSGVPAKPLDERARYDIVYMGHLREGQGLESLLTAFGILKKTVPQACLHIYGTGPLREKIDALIKRNGLEESVFCHGAISDHDKLAEMLSRHTIAAALYQDTKDNFTRYTDPGKVKVYLSLGLPMVITPVPEIAQNIEKFGCGYCVKDDTSSIADGLIRLLSDTEGLRQKIDACREMARKFTWDNIYSQAFEKSIKNIRK